MLLDDTVQTGKRRWKEEQLFLNLRGELSQLQDLAEPRPAHLSGLGQFPVVSNRAVRHQTFEVNGQSHEAAEARRAALRLALFFSPAYAGTKGNR